MECSTWFVIGLYWMLDLFEYYIGLHGVLHCIGRLVELYTGLDNGYGIALDMALQRILNCIGYYMQSNIGYGLDIEYRIG